MNFHQCRAVAGFEPCKLLTKHNSSTILATSGKISLTHCPAFSVLSKAIGTFHQIAGLGKLRHVALTGIGFAVITPKGRLWSKVSTCEGPPCMNKKMTRFARGVNPASLGDSGLTP